MQCKFRNFKQRRGGGGSRLPTTSRSEISIFPWFFFFLQFTCQENVRIGTITITGKSPPPITGSGINLGSFFIVRHGTIIYSFNGYLSKHLLVYYIIDEYFLKNKNKT